MTDARAEPERPLVAVIGGGVSGLAAARVLAGLGPVSEGGASAGGGRGVRVIVLEAGPAMGGKVTSGELAGQPVELGPDQFLRRDPSAERLCRILGLGEDLVAPAASTAAVWSRGEMRGLPRGLVLGVPTDLDAVASSGIVSSTGVDRARLDGELAGPVIQMADVGLGGRATEGSERSERSAGEILRARLGDEVVDRLVDPLLGGINAGSVDTMSLGTAAPQIARALVGHRDVIAPLAATAPPATGAGPPPSPFFGLRGGLSRLVDACCAELEQAGAELRAHSPVAAIRKSAEGGSRPWLVDTSGGTVACDGIVLAVPGFAGAELTKEVASGLSDELGAIPYATVAVVTLAFRAESLALPRGWTGVLVPRTEGLLMTAATWLSVKWPWMSTAENRYVRVSAGRFRDERSSELDDDELAAQVTRELRDVAGIEAPPFAHGVTRWDQAMPQYLPGHRDRIARISGALSATPGIEIAGALLGGIGIPACITSGEAAGSRLLGDLSR
ncbi:MAG: protoporphyrinogen oxidase [Acidimicrobiales bacterium]